MFFITTIKMPHKKNTGRKKHMLFYAFICLLISFAIGISFGRLSKTDKSSSSTQKSDIFSVEAGAYVENGLLDESKLGKIKLDTLEHSSGPEILIFHTHTGEKYSNTATVDDAAKYLADCLSKKGIGVVLDTTSYGLDVTDKSYEQSEEGVNKLLKKYPSVHILIDIHRDSGSQAENPVIGGKSYARLMLVDGVCALSDNGRKKDAGVENKYIKENLALSLALKKAADTAFPSLMKNIYIKPYRYSLNMKPMSVLLEAGNESDSIDDVKNALSCFSDILVSVIDKK